MLPLRVRLGQLLSTPGFVRQVFAVCVVLATFALIAAGHISVSIRIGDDGGSGDRVALDAAGDVTDGAGLRAGDSVPGGRGTGRTTTAGTRPSAGSPRSAVTGPVATRSGSASTALGPIGIGPATGDADPCAGATLTATDNGVTEDAITVALLTVNLANLDALGFGLATGNIDNAKILNAWANHLNANGGIACREVRFIEHETDLDVDRQIADCKALTQDIKVHAVLSPAGLVAGAQCITKDNHTPLVAALAAPDYWNEEGSPYLWDVLMSQDRILANHVEWLVDSGTIVPDEDLVGVVYAAEPYSGPSVENTMIPAFERLGVPVRPAELAYDAEQAAAQMAGVVVDFQTSGVTHVVFPVNFIYKTQFMQQAEQQQYFPEYSDDEATVGCQNVLTGTYPERSWDRAWCVSTGLLNGAPNGLRPGELQDYLATDPFAQLADQVYLATNPEGYDNGGQSDEDDTLVQQGGTYLYGSLILLWAQGADRVGPDLTRAAWGEAMFSTGVFDATVAPNPYTYGPGKYSGPDHIQIVQWHAEAGDGYESRLWRKLTDYFPAYH